MSSELKNINKIDKTQLSKKFLTLISKEINNPVSIMEVCGTHTMSIFRYGIRSLLPQKITLLSGPGCPVCVTDSKDIDNMISLAKLPDVIIATFGDLMRVPGSNSSLIKEKAKGAKIQVVYSPFQALELSIENPDKKIIFLAVGFETTIPTISATIVEAKKQNIKNFFIYNALKTMPKALEALFNMKSVNINGLLCPGHVSVIIGKKPYKIIPEKFGIPCVIAGFEPEDILKGIYLLAKQIKTNNPCVINAYERAVCDEGNLKALGIIKEVFKEDDAFWRGLGKIPQSGLKLRDEYKDFDACTYFDIQPKSFKKPSSSRCICGKIITAQATPLECTLFSKVCTPSTPIGPCMVSSEGTCSAYFKYVK